MQTGEYLEALGIVQYRRRALKASQSVIETRQSAKEKSEPELATNEQALEQTSEQVKVKPVIPVESQEAQQRPSPKPEHAVTDKQEVAFDLLIWKTEKLLIWEFSSNQTELSAAKHRLVNNVLKALWPTEFRGVQMFQQQWPLPDSSASKTSAGNWLNSMLSGYHQQGAAVPVWLMGEMGFELLLNQQDSYEDAQGSRIKHPQLEMEIFVGPALQTMLENPIAKARTWQMLRELSMK